MKVENSKNTTKNWGKNENRWSRVSFLFVTWDFPLHCPPTWLSHGRVLGKAAHAPSNARLLLVIFLVWGPVISLRVSPGLKCRIECCASIFQWDHAYVAATSDAGQGVPLRLRLQLRPLGMEMAMAMVVVVVISGSSSVRSTAAHRWTWFQWLTRVPWDNFWRKVTALSMTTCT